MLFSIKKSAAEELNLWEYLNFSGIKSILEMCKFENDRGNPSYNSIVGSKSVE